MGARDLFAKLEKAYDAYETLCQQHSTMVVSLKELAKSVGIDVEKCEEILKASGKYSIERGKDGIVVNKSKADAAPDTTIHDRIEKLLQILGTGLYEKDEALRLSLLAAIAGESIFFLGAPGSAKSMVARRVVQAFKADGDESVKYFETLLNQFSTPEDVFGNISLKALNGELEESKGKEEYRRLTEGMLPEADIAFLDEIWKASPAILNTLLTIINERKFHNGSKVVDCPLKGLLAASNELPAKDRGLEALYDRFVIRLYVDYIQNEKNFFDMVENVGDGGLSADLERLQISNDELELWKKGIESVPLSQEARDVISAVRKELTLRNGKLKKESDSDSERELFEVGDRRWKKIVHLLKTSAFLNGHREVDLMDCQIIEYCIWSTDAQRAAARKIVEKCMGQNGMHCEVKTEEISARIEKLRQEIGKRWYEHVVQPEKDKTKEICGDKCVECSDDRGNTVYVCLQGDCWYDATQRRHNDYYSVGFVRRGDSYVSRNNYYEFEVKKTPAKDCIQRKKLSNERQCAMQRDFDKVEYEPIRREIAKNLKELEDRKEAGAAVFAANLFTDSEYVDVIMAAFDDAKKELQDLNVELEKQHARYFNPKVSGEVAYSVGTVILKNGMAYSSAEVELLSEEEKKNVLDVVYSSGPKNWLLSTAEGKDEWPGAVELSVDGDSNWWLPDEDHLNEIFENKAQLNAVLKAVGGRPLGNGEYWSSSINEEKLPIYQRFDTGGVDYTTKSHAYGIRVVRECK